MFWKLRNKNYLTKNLILSWVFYPPVHPINHFKTSSNPSIAEDKVSINNINKICKVFSLRFHHPVE